MGDDRYVLVDQGNRSNGRLYAADSLDEMCEHLMELTGRSQPRMRTDGRGEGDG